MRFSLYITSLFLLPLLAASIYLEQLTAAVAAILIYVLTAYVSYNIGKRNAIQRGDSFVIFYKGWIFPTTIITPIYKVQAVELWRSIFIVQRQEIHFNLHTAAGSRNLKYFKEAEARALAQSIHSEVLLTERSWM
jgi:putative membrane protein